MASNVLKTGSAIRLGLFATDPSGSEVGTLYYNTASNSFRQFTSAGWDSVVTQSFAESIAAGFDPKMSCYLATAGTDLGSATYSNGTAGVGATLTATANGALSVDGLTPAVNDRILVKDQTSQIQNGIYAVTVLGSAGAAWVLTRTSDFDGSPANEVSGGDYVFIEAGTLNKATNWVLVSPKNSAAIGTDALVWTQTSATAGALAGLSDVQLSGLQDGQYLAYNLGSSKWENVSPSVPALSTLSDVSLSGLSAGQLLHFNGSVWDNASPASTATANSIIESNSSGFLDSSFLQYNVNFGGNVVSGVSTPVASTDAANKDYVDTALSSGGIAIGATIGSATQGSILFAGASGALSQDNAQLFWDDTNHYLGIGTATPSAALSVGSALTIDSSGNIVTSGYANITTGIVVGSTCTIVGSSGDITATGDAGFGTLSINNGNFTVDASGNVVGAGTLSVSGANFTVDSAGDLSLAGNINMSAGGNINGHFGSVSFTGGSFTNLSATQTKFNGLTYQWPTTQSGSQYLQTDGSGNLSWQTLSATLSGLTDVQISGLSDGQLLVYNQSASKWENGQGKLSNLSDVMLSSSTPPRGSILTYNGNWADTTTLETEMISLYDGTVGTSAAVVQQYYHSITLAANTTASGVSDPLNFAVSDFHSAIYQYQITDAQGDVRVGTLRCATDGTTTSLVDEFTETADCGVTWTAALSGNSIYSLTYTTTGTGTKTMRILRMGFAP